MCQRTPSLPGRGVRLVVSVLVSIVLVAGSGLPLLAAEEARGVAFAQVARPAGSPLPSPLPIQHTTGVPSPAAQPALMVQPTATSTALPVSAQPTSTPTRPAFVGSPGPLQSPGSSAQLSAPGSAPAGGPGTSNGGPSGPPPTPGPGCGPNGGPSDGCPAQARCDFDDDGWGDLAVGVPGEDDARGAVNVQYNQGGFLTTPALLHARHPAGDSILLGAKFGAALACGDFNDDGISDLAVGGPNTRTGGDVWIIWGKAGTGLDDNVYNVFHQDNDVVPGFPREDELFGLALASGDFNGDGIDDLAIGDPHERNPVLGYNTGMVVVVHGRKGGLLLERPSIGRVGSGMSGTLPL